MATPTVKIGFWLDGHVHAYTPLATPGFPFGDAYPGNLLARRIPLAATTSLEKAITRFNDYDGLGNPVDIAVNMGDVINAGDRGADRNTNFAAVVTGMGGIVGYSMYNALGHWDVGGGSPAEADYDAYFHNDGMGTIIPGDEEDAWTPAVAGTAGQYPCAYVIPHADFKIIVLCAILGSVTMTTQDAGGQSQQTWLDARLGEAEAASEPVIVICHQTIQSNAVSWQGTSVPGKIGGWAAVVTSLEGQTIKPIVFQGHIHYYDETFIVNGVTYFNLKGDVWGVNELDTGRYSYSVATITGPTYVDANGPRCLVELEGYGYQKSEDMTMALVARWKLNEANGTAAGANAIVDSSGNAYHGTNSEDVVSVVSPVGHGISLDGTGDYIDDAAVPLLAFPCSFSVWYKIATSQTSSLLSISLAAGTGAGARYMDLRLLSGTPYLNMKGGAAAPATVPASLEGVMLNQWVFVVGVWTSSALRDIYINGKFSNTSTVNTAATAFPTTADIITIGARSHDGGQIALLTGELSDARIHSGGLSVATIHQMYREGVRKYSDLYGPGSNSLIVGDLDGNRLTVAEGNSVFNDNFRTVNSLMGV